MSDIPIKFSLKKYISYLPSQERTDCCTAMATLLAVEIIMAQSDNTIRFSRLFLYYMTRKLQGRIGQRGAELGMTLHALTVHGVSTEAKWPFSYSRINMEPNVLAIEDASKYKLKSYRIVEYSEFKKHLLNGTPIIVGMFTGRQFWKISGSIELQNYMPINDTTNRPSKGHAITIIGYDDELNGGSWIIGNSLGLAWGDKGYGAIPYSCNADFGESYIIEDFL